VGADDHVVPRRPLGRDSQGHVELARLTRFNPVLHSVITLTSDRALAQARDADREIAAGKYRRPLHGIPWGAKDLLSVKDYPTTWGAGWLREQRFDSDATVVQWLNPECFRRPRSAPNGANRREIVRRQERA
jgi:hypothetical protein